MKTLTLVLLSLWIGFVSCKKSKSSGEENLSDAELSSKVIASGLSHVWEMVYTADDQLWFTERGGKISRINIQTGEKTLIHTVSNVVARGEGGLLGMVLHPQFPAQPYVYVVYNYNRSGTYTERVARFTYSNNSLSAELVLLDQIPANNNHNGSRLVISSDKLFISTGDAEVASSAQNLNSLSGKILRINLDGSIPADNPFNNSPVWSYGHRNPQGLVFANNKLYASEHGPDKDDEINLIEKGRNYGWPNVNGFCDESGENTFCSNNNVREPLKSWTPTIAPSGLTYYNHSLIPQWKNSLILAVLKGSRIIRVQLDDAGNAVTATEDFFANEYGRKRAVCVAPNGKVYFATSNGSDDKIIEISRSN
jgi:glucose/arabinose dehydrogenase